MSDAAAKHDVFQAIADPTRRQLLKLISEQERSVTELCAYFPITRPAVSKHLRVLAEAGLVLDRKAGRETRISLNPEPLLELQDWLSYFGLFWDNKIAALQQFIEKNE